MICKKRFYVAVLICLVSILALGSPMAATGQAAPDKLVFSGITPSPMFLYINRVTTSLSIQTNGTATATGSLIGYQGLTDEVWIYLDLEIYIDGSWQTYDSWSQIYYSYRGTLQKTSMVVHGYNYRVRGYYYAWVGNQYEYTTGYSSTKYY